MERMKVLSWAFSMSRVSAACLRLVMSKAEPMVAGRPWKETRRRDASTQTSPCCWVRILTSPTGDTGRPASTSATRVRTRSRSSGWISTSQEAPSSSWREDATRSIRAWLTKTRSPSCCT